MRDLPGNINIFILHSKKDRDLKSELKNHLSLLERLGYVDIWYEDLIEAGENTKEVMAEYLQKAHVILLLISANFFSPECYDEYANEIRLAYERQRQGEVKIVPVILRPCDWQLDILASLNPLPKDGHPVLDTAHWDSSDKAFREITVELRQMVHEIKKTWQEVKERVEKSKKTIERNIATAAFETELNDRISKEVGELRKGVSEKLENIRNHRFSSTKTTESSSSDSGQDDTARNLLNSLLDLLLSQDLENAIASFRSIGHESLFHSAKVYNAFLKNEFEKAFSRAELYATPAEIIKVKSSGRHSIRYGGLKQEGQELVYTISKKQAVGSFPGQIRIFFPDDLSPAKISKLSL